MYTLGTLLYSIAVEFPMQTIIFTSGGKIPLHYSRRVLYIMSGQYHTLIVHVEFPACPIASSQSYYILGFYPVGEAGGSFSPKTFCNLGGDCSPCPPASYATVDV